MNYQQVRLLLMVLFVLYGFLRCKSASITSRKDPRKQIEAKSNVDDPQQRADEPSDYYLDAIKSDAGGPPSANDLLDEYADDSMKGFPFDQEHKEFGDDEVVYVVKSSQDSDNNSANGLLITKEYIASMPLRLRGSINVCLNERCQPATVFKDKVDFLILSIEEKRNNVQGFATLEEGEKYECLANYVALMVNVVREKDTIVCTPQCADGMVLTCDHKPAGLVRMKDGVAKFYSAQELFMAAMERDKLDVPSAPKRVDNKPSEDTGQKMRSSNDAETITVSMLAFGFLPTVSLLFHSKSYVLL